MRLACVSPTPTDFEPSHRASTTRELFDRRRSLHIATALVVSFLGQLAIELAVLHLTAALVHRPAGYAASDLLFGAKRGSCEDRKRETNA